MTDRGINIIHRLVVPFIHTIIWSIGILLCFQSPFSRWSIVENTPDGHAFAGIISIYLVYLTEMFLALLDTALKNKEKTFRANLLCLIAWFILNIGTTFLLSLLFMANNSYNLLCAIVVTVILLKFTELFFNRNPEVFMRKMCECSIKSRTIQ